MRPLRILVVDDTSEIRTLLSRVLTGQGYDVLEACDGQEALSTCRGVNGDVDLLLTDIKMPRVDGVELATTLTASYPSIRVLYISGQCDTDEIQAQVSERGFGFLSKPFMPDMLIRRVEQVLTPARRPVQAAKSNSSIADRDERLS